MCPRCVYSYAESVLPVQARLLIDLINKTYIPFIKLNFIMCLS